MPAAVGQGVCVGREARVRSWWCEQVRGLFAHLMIAKSTANSAGWLTMYMPLMRRGMHSCMSEGGGKRGAVRGKSRD